MSIKAKITTQPTIIVEVGVKGKQGADGVTFYPNVSENGDLSWTNDGGLSNPKTVNVKGGDGYTPVKGVDYFTEEDIAYIVNAVLAALGGGNGDGNGDEPTIPENILLSADGLMLTDIDGIYLMPAISA